MYCFKRINQYFQSEVILLDIKQLAFMIASITILILITGIGGFFPQSGDHIARNPVFYDLINQKWPVVYDDTNAALTYYLGFFLFPALMGKIANIFVSDNTTWLFANMILMFQTIVYIVFSMLLIVVRLNISEKKQRFLRWLPLLFFGFSGVHIIGQLVASHLNGPIEALNLTLEWYGPKYPYHGIWVAISYAYNQVVPAILATILFLNSKNAQIYAVIGLSLLITSPFPLIGLIALMLVRVLTENQFAIRKVLQNCLTIPNFLMIVVGILILPYYLGVESSYFVFMNVFVIDHGIFRYLLFCFCEFGLAAIILYRFHYKNVLFITSIILLTIIPFIALQDKIEFQLRVSTVPIICLMIFFCDFSYYYYENEKKSPAFKATIPFFTLAILTLVIRLMGQLSYIPVAGTTHVLLYPEKSFSYLKGIKRFPYASQYVKRNANTDFFFRTLCDVNFSNTRTPDIVLRKDGSIKAITYRNEDLRYLESLTTLLSNTLLYTKDDTSTEQIKEIITYFPEPYNVYLDQPELLEMSSLTYELIVQNYPDVVYSQNTGTVKNATNPYQLNILLYNTSNQVIWDSTITDSTRGIATWFSDESNKAVSGIQKFPLEYTILPGDKCSLSVPLLEGPQSPGVYDFYISLYETHGENEITYAEPFAFFDVLAK